MLVFQLHSLASSPPVLGLLCTDQLIFQQRGSRCRQLPITTRRGNRLTGHQAMTNSRR